MGQVELVNVFAHRGQGGNACPIVLDAHQMSPSDMRAVAFQAGLESGFILPPTSTDYDYAFRFWVPNHEMEMCGHATIGMLWLLATRGRLAASEVRIETRSGPVTGFVTVGAEGKVEVEITQPAGKVIPLDSGQEAAVLSALKLSRTDLLDLPLQNAATARVKTLIPLRDRERLDALTNDMDATEKVCSAIGSTGLYPYAPSDNSRQIFEARQFPRSSGYPEDAATGIAAAALAFGLLRNGLISPTPDLITIMQGRAMGRLSEVRVRLGFAGHRTIGCLLSGDVTITSSATSINA
jgi:PhzF family phenazine biosynthesis protein